MSNEHSPPVFSGNGLPTDFELFFSVLSLNHCSKLELERTGKGRLETQVTRLREVVERQGKEAEGLRAREKAASEEAKKATKQWREVSK